jgi:magnesium transporter
MKKRNYLDYIINPLDLLRTKKVLHVNPTIDRPHEAVTTSKIFLYEYDKSNLAFFELKSIEETYPHLDSPGITWINIDGLNKAVVENICTHFGIHQLITEDILSVGQRPKMDEINNLVFCLLNMLYFNEKDSSVETEQISIVLGKNFVISFQEDASKDVFNPLR